MTIYKRVPGVTKIKAEDTNNLLTSQAHKLIFAATQFAAKTGAGVSEYPIDTANRAFRFTMAGTELGYLSIEGKKAGTGADLTVEIRSAAFNPDGSSMGVLIETKTIPKQFIGTAGAYLVLPLGLTGLTNAANYWVVIKQAGDGTNHIDLVGEASQDASYPAYSRNGSTGAWTVQNALHWKAHPYPQADSASAGDLIAGIYDGRAIKWLEWTGEELTTVKRYIPALTDEEDPIMTGITDPGIREVKTYTRAGQEGSVVRYG